MKIEPKPPGVAQQRQTIAMLMKQLEEARNINRSLLGELRAVHKINLCDPCRLQISLEKNSPGEK